MSTNLYTSIYICIISYIAYPYRAGKTTLLKQILQTKEQNFKIAIIINDMGALNLDAEEIKKHKLIQEKQEMVEVCLLFVVSMDS